MNEITNFEIGNIIYATNISDNNDLIDYESFISLGNDEFIETWYFGMIIDKDYIIDAYLKPRKIFKTKNTKINKIGEIDKEIIDLFKKINEEYLNENNRL